MLLLSLFIILQSDSTHNLCTGLQELYESGKYFAVIEKADSALKDTGLTSEDEVGIHTILAFCYTALDKPRLAKLEFLEALTIDQNLELDPVLISPKIIKVFKEAKSSFRFFAHEKPEALHLRQIKKDFITFTIPGIWDIRKENKKRGYFLLGWSSASALSLGFSHYQCEKYHQEYLDARTPDIIEDKYKKNSSWYQIRAYSLASLVLTYTINLFLLAVSP